MDARRALTIALFLSSVIFLLELSGGILFRSTALMADALHIVTDILAVLFSLVALSVSSRPPTSMLTYGYHRFEVLASLVNGLSLFAIVGIIMYEAYLRFLAPQPILILGTAIFASVAILLNIIASKILNNAQAKIPDHKDENVASTELHLLGDALSSLAVIVGAAAVFLTRQYYLDPLIAAFIGLIVLRSAMRMTVQAGAIFLERSPLKDTGVLRQKLADVEGVIDVHDLHVWRICSHITVASIHACLDPDGKNNSTSVRNQLKHEMSQLGIDHVTIQLEDACCVPVHGHEKRSFSSALRK
jgi:cobalt-zinc-cadmium efflux system protein